jgi:hypothetical protein
LTLRILVALHQLCCMNLSGKEGQFSNNKVKFRGDLIQDISLHTV